MLEVWLKAKHDIKIIWLQYYNLDNLIIIILAIEAIFKFITQYNSQYKKITNIFDILYKKFKIKISIVILIFGIFIDINLLKVSLLPNKIYKIIIVIASTLYQNFFTLKKA